MELAAEPRTGQDSLGFSCSQGNGKKNEESLYKSLIHDPSLILSIVLETVRDIIHDSVL